MHAAVGKPAPGLYFIATPIGAARDITLRALDLLATADVLAAEDTRTLRHLMDIHGVALADRPLWAYHDHNGARVRPRIMAALAAGKAGVYASEAGTPLVADPGYQLGRAAIEAGHMVTAEPGPSAVLAALTVSGLPSDRFLFAGFPPTATQARRTWLKGLSAIPATVILYESPNRIGELLTDLVQSCGGNRRAVVCRELTKKFEEISRGMLSELQAGFDGRKVRGEIVVLVDRPGAAAMEEEAVRAALKEAMRDMSVRDAAAMVAEMTGQPRRDMYRIALSLGRDR